VATWESKEWHGRTSLGQGMELFQSDYYRVANPTASKNLPGSKKEKEGVRTPSFCC
jgi:hypothetical protein